MNGFIRTPPFETPCRRSSPISVVARAERDGQWEEVLFEPEGP
jgi:hypothetical protein